MNHIGKYNGSDIAEVIRRVLEESKTRVTWWKPNLVSTEDLIATIEKYNLRNEKRNPLVSFLRISHLIININCLI